MSDWVELTVSEGHFLAEITAGLRDAGIELRLSDPVDGVTPGVRAGFGAKTAAPKVIAVPAARLDDARALVRAIFDGAEAAAMRESGAPAPSFAEQDEDLAWRAEVERRRARGDRNLRRFAIGLGVFFVLIAAVVVYLEVLR